jgi:hypothetical protein
MSQTYSQTPFTITGQDDIPAEAPRSQGMDDTAALAVVAANDDLMAQALHLHLDLVGYTLTVGLDNAVDGAVFWIDFGDGNNAELTAPDAATHDYVSDGVYTVAAYTRTGPPEMTQQQIAINWPEPLPAPPDPEPIP